MHLVLIITDYGSFNNFLSELAVRMVQDGHEIDVICSNEKVIAFNDRIDYKKAGVTVHFMSFPRGFNFIKQLSASVQISRLISTIKPDIVHAHFTTGIFTTVLYKKPDYPMVGTIHGLGYPLVQGVRKIIFKMVETFCFSRIDRLLVLNTFDYNLLSNKIKQKTSILQSAGLGCDLARFDITNFSAQTTPLRDSLNIEKESFVITYTGRFVHFKGFDLVVRSFLKLNKAAPSTYKLILIGGSDPVHPTGLSELEAVEYKSCPEILQIGFTNEVEKYLSISDVFVFPSIKEGMPVCVMEALAMGVPVITADSRGCNELVIDGKNGYLLSVQPTVDEIMLKVAYLKSSQDVMSQLKKYAFANRYKLNRDIFIKKQIEDYQNIMKR